MTVNTIYFWSNPVKLIGEIERTLKLNGICVLTFGDKDFMQKLPVNGRPLALFWTGVSFLTITFEMTKAVIALHLPAHL